MLETFLAMTSAPECAHVVVPQASEQAMSYYYSGNVLWLMQLLLSLVIPFLFLYTGLSGTLANTSKKWGKYWYPTIVIYLVLFILIYTLLNLPIDFYTGYMREHIYHLSSQTLGRWFESYGKQLLVSIVSAALFVWIFYYLIKKSPRRWWFYSGIASTLILFFMMFVQPIWIDPLFNDFGPMKNKELEQEILSLAHQAGISDGRVYEVDKSKDTDTLNAYVVGFGSTSRIVLWDTTVQKLPADQIRFIMGHEMGHYVLHHVWWSLLYFSALSFAVFYLTYRAAHYFTRKYKKRFGFSDLSNIASLPLLILLTSVLIFLASPLTNAISRCMEHEADRFGLEITHDNQAAGEAFVSLQEQNLANPYPGKLYQFFRCTHPPLGERVAFCNSYCPWTREEPLKYGKYFTAP